MVLCFPFPHHLKTQIEKVPEKTVILSRGPFSGCARALKSLYARAWKTWLTSLNSWDTPTSSGSVWMYSFSVWAPLP